MRGFFGRGKNRPASEKPAAPRQAGDAGHDEARSAQWPWVGKPDHVACNFAVAHLLINLPARVGAKQQAHGETCLAAIGAIAGLAAQRALFTRIKQTQDEALLEQLHMVKARQGTEYYAGEPLNRMLVPSSPAEDNQRLWPIVASTAVSAGLPRAQLPALKDMFAHVANTLGTEAEGLPSVSRHHHPRKPAGELLQALWPLALMCFGGRFPKVERDFGQASEQHWPVISACVASALMRKMPPTLDPRTALIIVMESAIYGSKLSPAVVNRDALQAAGTLH
jgi:hypothetical protein